MLWDKRKYEIQVKGGCGELLTDGMHGLIQQLIVTPDSKNTIWSISIRDKGNDIVYELIDHEGRLDEKSGIPVGADQQERLSINIFDTTANEKFEILFIVRERL